MKTQTREKEVQQANGCCGSQEKPKVEQVNQSSCCGSTPESNQPTPIQTSCCG